MYQYSSLSMFGRVFDTSHSLLEPCTLACSMQEKASCVEYILNIYTSLFVKVADFKSAL